MTTRITMRFSEFADYVNGFTGDRPEDMRLGQWAFVLLHEMYPLIAGPITGSMYDPFYRDDLLPRFLSHILLTAVTMDPPPLKAKRP